MNSCEDISDPSFGTHGKTKGSSQAKKVIDSSGTRNRPATYSHALKMRSAISYWFAFKCPVLCGSTEWQQVRSTSKFQGNPSLSPMVMRYMRALHNKKVAFNLVSLNTSLLTRYIDPCWRGFYEYSCNYTKGS